MKELEHFVRRKDFLICVDSDGCAMDTMNVKHDRCFGPCMVKEWALEPWADCVLKRWNEINLYSVTRGVNRFLGLAQALQEINAAYCTIPGLEELIQWTNSAKELSNDTLRQACAGATGPCMAKALAWSEHVNRQIDALPAEDKKAFPGVADGLGAAHRLADIAVVSSANWEAVEEEWNRCGILGSVDVLCCQDTGNKAHCIGELMKLGYRPDRALMVGDAPGDQKAAQKNGVLFYPILVRKEAESWRVFPEIVQAFVQGQYGTLSEKFQQQFLENLGVKNS